MAALLKACQCHVELLSTAHAACSRVSRKSLPSGLTFGQGKSGEMHLHLWLLFVLGWCKAG